MYLLLYIFFFLLSLLPFFILYGIGEFAFFIVYRVLGYRKKIVLENLQRAFPEKTEIERRIIAKQFYRNLIDNFLEMIKMLSMSSSSFRKHAVFNLKDVDPYIKEGRSVVFLSGHQMNWEWSSWALADGLKIPLFGLYLKVSNRAIDKLLLHIRNRSGTILIDATKFSTAIARASKSQHAIGLIADQTPPPSQRGCWMNFFGVPVPFMIGPEKMAAASKSVVFFVRFVKHKRGYYTYEPHLITADASQCNHGEVMRSLRDLLEQSIKEQPSNYLWSHRRWKRKYDNSQKESWIDVVPPPEN